ncbi:PcfJ domain-containing protein [Methylotuvimicrobium sp. KM1]|uniref:PcfJ domain-containing protein n=1 Tax=Methylotuvimicrobium sp. KM1 TaxID=3377707 RepID=UPI00384D4C5A
MKKFLKTDSSIIKIDFSIIEGCKNYLLISSWNHGIDWLLIVDNKEIESRRPLTDSAIHLSYVLSNPEYKNWVMEIPNFVINSINPYSGVEFIILNLISHYKAAYDLYFSSKNLLWILIYTARIKKWSEQDVLKLASIKRRDILVACGLPGTEAAVNVLNKISFDTFDITAYQLIYRVLRLNGYEKLIHHEIIDFRLIYNVLAAPWLIDTSFLKNCHPDNWPIGFHSRIEDVQRMAARLGVTQEVNKALKKQIKTYASLKQLHDRLADRINKQTIEELPDNNFPQAPILGNNAIVPITGSRMLALEGRAQHHCVRSYESRIQRGEYYVYKVLAPERATLGLMLSKNENKPIFDQLYLDRNRPVSEATKESVMKWLNNRI